MPSPTSPGEQADKCGGKNSVERGPLGAEEFKTVAIFCGLGLLLSLVAAVLYGLDCSAF